MLITIQFPLADSIAFSNINTQRLVVPSWLIPNPDHDFVRSFGIIRRRPRGGLSGWLGESYICEANNAVRFQGLKPFLKVSGDLIKFKVVFRRLYFDGLSVGKFEIGLAAWCSKKRGFWIFNKASLSEDETRELLSHVLKLPVLIHNSYGELIKCQLSQAGQPIARLYATSRFIKQDFAVSQPCSEDWWIQSCEPLILITYQEDLKITYQEKRKRLKISGIGGALSHHVIQHEGQNIRMWLMQDFWVSNRSRQLRIFLLRLHAEQTCFRQILRNISTGKLEISKRSEQSRMLQEYLNRATKRIKRLNELSFKRVEVDVGELAREAEDYFAPGERDALFEALRVIDIEKNIFHKIENFASSLTIIEKQIIGDVVMSESKGNINITGVVQGNISGIAASGETQIMTGVTIGSISGSVTNTINQLPVSTDPHSLSIRDLLIQLQAAIESESELTDDDKAEALEQVKKLAEAGQKPEDNVFQKVAKTSMKILKGTISSLPDAAKLVESCAKLLPAIAKLLALV